MPARTEQAQGRYGWFGAPWPSGICDDPDAVQLDTPVGEKCGYCREEVEDGDQGSFYADGQPQHRECGLRAVIGSVAHLEKRCSCYVPGATETDTPGLTLREGAIATWLWIQQHGFPHVRLKPDAANVREGRVSRKPTLSTDGNAGDERPVQPAAPPDPTGTLAGYLSYPEADPEGGCPNCSGIHYGAVKVVHGIPSIYRCHGTEWPNANDAPERPSCGTLFRGIDGVHFHSSDPYWEDFFKEAESNG